MPTTKSLSNKHDHQSCVENAIAKAYKICDESEIRFTSTRKRILELIWETHKPVLAYDLLKSLRHEQMNAEPPTVYRALDFLRDNQLIHKIESLNAYIGCLFPERNHFCQFLICCACQQAEEIESNQIERAVNNQARQNEFKVAHQTIEIFGLCATCQ